MPTQIKRVLHKYAFAGVVVISLPATAGNLATCILDSMPGLQNDSAAMAAFQVCATKYPGGYEGIPQGDGRWLFGFDSGAACTAKKAADTSSRIAGQYIFFACKRLYDKPPAPNPFDRFDDPAKQPAK
jgi:hypothetical protein